MNRPPLTEAQIDAVRDDAEFVTNLDHERFPVRVAVAESTLQALDDREALIEALEAWRAWLQDGNPKPYSKKAWALTEKALERVGVET